ncbi:MAG TPA: LPXTG cell wall anchor domain-containing protein [Candidatus Dormibacteraeota bacterium]
MLARLVAALTALAVAFPDPRRGTLLSPKRRQRRVKMGNWRTGLVGGAGVLLISSGIATTGVAALISPANNCTALAPCYDINNYNLFQLSGDMNHRATTGNSLAWSDIFNGSGANGSPPAGSLALGTTIVGKNKAGTTDTYTLIGDTFINDSGTDPALFGGTTTKDITDISQWRCTPKPVTPKDEINNAYATLWRDNGQPSHTVMYMAVERTDVNGTANNGFWLLQQGSACDPATGHFSGGHKKGDLFFFATFNGGGSTATILTYTWSADGTAGHLVAGTTGTACSVDVTSPCGMINASPVTAPWPNQNNSPTSAPNLIPQNGFFEFGVDLYDFFGVGSGGHIPCFASFLVDSRSSGNQGSAVDAELHDFMESGLDTCPTPSIATTASQTPANGIVIGTTGTVSDSATLSGGNNPTGTVTFNLYGPTGSGASAVCNDTDHVLGPFTENLNGVSASTGPHDFTPPAIGTYYWTASYSGDTGNSASGPSGCGDAAESISVIQATSATVTNLSSGTVSVGDQVSDSATVSGVTTNATGTVTFHVFTDNACGTLATTGAGGDISAQPTTATDVNNGNGTISATSSLVTFQKAGPYWWEAVYSGDANNIGSHSACDSEPLTVNAPHLALAKTTTDTAPVNAGTTINYTVTITNDATNGANAYGVTVSDTVPTNGGLNWTVASTTGGGTWTLSGGVLSFSDATLAAGDSASVTITSPTTAATCGVVSNSASATSTNDGSPSIGPVNITVNCPTNTTTQLSATSISVGQTASDSAQVTGASPSAGGTVTFAVYTDNACSAAATTGASGEIDAQPTTATDTNTGGTIKATSSKVTFQQAGTYYWQASYSGDSEHNTGASKSVCGTEVINVLAPALSLNKTADHTAAVAAGTPIGFTVTFGNSGVAGTGTAAGVLLSDPLPNVPSTSTDNFSWAIDGTPSLTSDLVSQGVTCQIIPATATSGQTLFCGLGSSSQGVFTMIPGSSISVHMTHQTDSASAGTYPNTARVACLNETTCPLSSSASEAVFVAAVQPIHLAKTGDWTIFMVLGAPLILIGLLLLVLSRRRREGEA